MGVKSYSSAGEKVPRFKSQFFESGEIITRIGTGSLGGKALGLAFIKDTLTSKIDPSNYGNITVNIPTLAVIATDSFDRFMQINNLYEIDFSEMPDDRIAHAFQNAELPPELNGDLRRLIADVRTPLAIRSSSLLED
ncbi:MAG: phosphoenolpyruvate synthase, partial [candidate division Zixibacteria bacterium]|nr:phosphoenolpyruvate synthase [candidate division Zixibacteria bacterium]NIT53231.1 phosphoenolpyruvate synthase [candidate division Zixibacteria bacterium]NIW41465.1 phosphoenolpyruvate synthase [candidate division Zixibacteria bacterium]NIX55143.1 phosphoenolpyruvate synthase [candidate division Zixibacteria bacterium]